MNRERLVHLRMPAVASQKIEYFGCYSLITILGFSDLYFIFHHRIKFHNSRSGKATMYKHTMFYIMSGFLADVSRGAPQAFIAVRACARPGRGVRMNTGKNDGPRITTVKRIRSFPYHSGSLTCHPWCPQGAPWVGKLYIFRHAGKGLNATWPRGHQQLSGPST